MPIECFFELTADQKSSRERNLIKEPSLRGSDRICSVGEIKDKTYS